MISGYDDAMLYSGSLGTYDPRFGFAYTFSPTTTLTNSSAIYELATVGLLASTFATRYPEVFSDLKWQLSQKRPRSMARIPASSEDNIHLCTLGRCGLYWQPYTTDAGARVASIANCALLGLIFRESPAAFGGRGIKE